MKDESRVSRRDFLAAGGAGLVAGVSGNTWAASAPAAWNCAPAVWNHEADIIVVGSGAAACSAAACAASKGKSVIMLEKAAFPGGTTGKSGGGWWAPNNPLLQRDGIADPKPDAVKYMARCSFPTRYNPELPRLGLVAEDYELLDTYYDHASRVTGDLEKLGALKHAYFLGAKGDQFLDYYSHFPEDKAPRGRCLCPAGLDGKAMPIGGEMIRQMLEYSKGNGAQILLGHEARTLHQAENGVVNGVTALHDRKPVSFRAKRGVIFGTGGFSQNPQMALNFLRGPIFGGCAAPTNTGDFVFMATGVGAQLGNMNNAWWAQIVLEEALKNRSVPTDVFNLPGDSTLLVNRYGRRVVNEKMVYNERTQAHFYWDPSAGEFPNLLLFMFYDQRTIDNLGVRYSYPVPPKGQTAPHVISGETLTDLERNLNDRLKSLADRLPAGLVLDGGFGRQLEATIERFNQFAESGVDEDFHRGRNPIDQSFQVNTSNGKPNPTLYPISSKGPYHVVILAAGTLDTKGGPRINRHAQVLDRDGKPILGLYGAGNCISSPAAQAYWSGGATLGPALTFGYLAAEHATDA